MYNRREFKNPTFAREGTNIGHPAKFTRLKEPTPSSNQPGFKIKFKEERKCGHPPGVFPSKDLRAGPQVLHDNLFLAQSSNHVRLKLLAVVINFDEALP